MLDKMTKKEKEQFHKGLMEWEATIAAEIDMGKLLQDMWEDQLKNNPDLPQEKGDD